MHQGVHPAWYFLPVLLAGIGPWLLPFLAALRPRDDRELFLVIWALVVLAFFSASGSKLPPYILPMFPALALLIGRRLAGDARRRLLIAQSALLVVMSIAGVILVAGFAPDNYADYARWVALAFAPLAVAAIAALVCALRSAITGAVLCLAAGGLIATVLGLAAHRTLSDRFSVASTVAKLAERPSASTPVFAVDMYDHTLPWSLKRTVTMVAHRDELEVAIGWEPQKFIRPGRVRRGLARHAAGLGLRAGRRRRYAAGKARHPHAGDGTGIAVCDREKGLSRNRYHPPVPDFLPFTRPDIDEATIAGVGDVLRSGWITSGPQVKAFEAALSRYCGGRPVRCFNSGTATLEVGLRLAGVGEGHEVITTPLSWVATANVALEVQARPVFVDVDPRTRNIDLNEMEKAITPATRAIIPVDLAGLPVDRDRLNEIANRRKLRVVEDAAQAFGA